MNMRDGGLGDQITIGLREGGESWNLAKSDGWVEGESLLSIADAAAKGTVVMWVI